MVTTANIYEMVDSWITATVTYTAIKMNVTDTSSAAASKLIDLQVGSTSMFYVDKSGNLALGGTVDGRDIAADGTKLDTIESGATADQTGSEIKALYEVQTSAFTDAQFNKLTDVMWTFGNQSAMIASTNFSVGDLVMTQGDAASVDDRGTIWSIVAAGTHTTSSTVLNLTGIPGQAVSTNSKLVDVIDLLADTRDYTIFSTNDIITTATEGFRYKVAASGATDHQLTTAGGVKLYVLASADGIYNVKAFGAVGDGVADDKTAIQAMLSVGNVGYLPEGNYRTSGGLSITTRGYHLSGDGTNSKITIDDMVTAINVISVSSAAGTRISNIHVVPTCATIQSTFANYGIYVTASNSCVIEDCEVSSHRQGIQVNNSNGCLITNNYIHTSVVDTTKPTSTDLHPNTGADIRIQGTSSETRVLGNRIKTGAGVGILCQTLSAGTEEQKYTIISENQIDDCPQYGIAVYRTDGPPDEIKNVTVSNNSISNIWGNIDDGTGQQIWGAGIYIQGAKYVSVVGNTLFNTNVHTNIELVGIAAISTANTKQVVIDGNFIKAPQWYGISVTDVNSQGEVNGGIIVSNNNISDSIKDSIQVKGLEDCVISGNRMDGSGAAGILVKDSGTGVGKRAIVTSNMVYKPTSAGISVTGHDKIVMSNNIVTDSVAAGIAATGTGYASVVGNNVSGCLSHGINIGSTVADGVVTGNVSIGNKWNYTLNGSVLFKSNIWAGGTTSDFNGTFVPGRILTDGDTTPSVKNDTYVRTSNSAATSITNFNNGTLDQTLTLRFGDVNTTIVHNAAILRLAGNINFVPTNGSTLTFLNTGGFWDEVSRMVR